MSYCLKKGDTIIGLFDNAHGVYDALRSEGWSWKILDDGKYQFVRTDPDGKTERCLGECPNHPAFQRGYSLALTRNRDKYFIVFQKGKVRAAYWSIDSYFSTDGRSYTLKDKMYSVTVNGVPKGTYAQLETAFISIYFDYSFVLCPRSRELDDSPEKVIFMRQGNYVCMEPSYRAFLWSQAAMTEGKLVITPRASLADGKAVISPTASEVVSATFGGSKVKATTYEGIFNEVFASKGWSVVLCRMAV